MVVHTQQYNDENPNGAAAEPEPTGAPDPTNSETTADAEIMAVDLKPLPATAPSSPATDEDIGEDGARKKRTKRKDVGFAETNGFRVDLRQHTFGAVDTEGEIGAHQLKTSFIAQAMPALFEEPENNPVDIVLVFDRSGSVFGNRCNEAEQEFIKQLPGYVKGRMAMNGGKLFGKPSVHIATFGCQARMETTEPIDVTREDADEQVTAVTKKFINMGGTNISDGIACAVNKLATLECSDPNSARSGVIVVLTDGQAGAGATTPAEIADYVRDVLKPHPNWSLWTLGFCDCENRDYLTAAANAGRGRF